MAVIHANREDRRQPPVDAVKNEARDENAGYVLRLPAIPLAAIRLAEGRRKRWRHVDQPATVPRLLPGLHEADEQERYESEKLFFESGCDTDSQVTTINAGSGYRTGRNPQR
jgi:hypothetical protein